MPLVNISVDISGSVGDARSSDPSFSRFGFGDIVPRQELSTGTTEAAGGRRRARRAARGSGDKRTERPAWGRINS